MQNRTLALYIALITALIVWPGVAKGEQMRHLKGRRLMKAPVLDGVIDPVEWEGASHDTGFTDPVTGKLATDQTEVWMGYNDSSIYIGFYCHDAHPDQIVGREIRPGSDFVGEDTIAIRINPFGTRGYDGRSRFIVNVLNTESEEIAGGRAAKREWRGDWQSSVKRQPDGWSVEVRIPWGILNYPSKRRLSMDLNFERFHARTKAESEWSNTTTSGRPEYAGYWDSVEPPVAENRKPLQFLAYMAPEFDTGTSQFRTGLDARYAISPTLTAIGTISPDFRNIESQIAGIEFTRTERYLNESRPFFTEGGDFFNTVGEFNFGTMFYSRRINTFDLGSKFFGQITPTLAVGALTTVEKDVASASVVKVQQTYGPKASIGAYATRYENRGVVNNATGIDLNGRRGSFSGQVNMAASQYQGTKAVSAGSVSLSYEVPHWFSLLREEWIPADFASPLAYIPWTDKRGWYNFTEYSNAFRKGPFQNVDLNVFTTSFNDYSGKLLQQGSDIGASVVTRSDVRVEVNRSNTRYADGVDEVTGIGITLNSSNRFRRFGTYFETGSRSSEPSNYLSFSASNRILKGLDIGVQYAVLRFNGTDTQTIGTIGYEISPTRSLSARFVQHGSDSNIYLAFRNGGSKGTEYYFILGDPNALKTQNRVSVKVVWAF